VLTLYKHWKERKYNNHGGVNSFREKSLKKKNKKDVKKRGIGSTKEESLVSIGGKKLPAMCRGKTGLKKRFRRGVGGRSLK